ncbi:peptide deformylase [Rickettsiales bacterium]|nr:peptide deformylase [Rickettsiales bacterium]
MSLLPLVYAPNKIFQEKALPVEKVDDEIRELIDDMFETLYFEQAVGIGANMVGILRRIAIVDMYEDGKPNPYVFINPEITYRSKETQTFEEASICYRGISAKITRPSSIKVKYLDKEGKNQELEANGFFASVIQHEIDYLDGKVYLDYLSKMKRDMLLKKMDKYIKMHPPHIHSASCNH